MHSALAKRGQQATPKQGSQCAAVSTQLMDTSVPPQPKGEIVRPSLGDSSLHRAGPAARMVHLPAARTSPPAPQPQGSSSACTHSMAIHGNWGSEANMPFAMAAEGPVVAFAAAAAAASFRLSAPPASARPIAGPAA